MKIYSSESRIFECKLYSCNLSWVFSEVGVVIRLLYPMYISADNISIEYLSQMQRTVNMNNKIWVINARTLFDREFLHTV